MIYARLKSDSPFYSVFPGGLVPLVDAVARMVLLDDHSDVPKACYRVDVAALAPALFEQVVRVLTGGQPDATVECVTQLATRGLPLRISQTLSLVEADSPAGPATPINAIPDTPRALDLRNF